MKPKTSRQPSTGRLLLAAAATLLMSANAFAQTTVAVAPSKLNVLYIGVDNPVNIAASNAADDKVTVSASDGGSVTKLGAGLYNVRVSAPTDDYLLNVFVDGKLAGSSRFRVRNLPVPTATVGGYTSGYKVPADGFRSQAGLGVFVKDFQFDVRYEVLGFTLTVDDDKGDIRAVDCQGASFSPAAKQIIQQFVKPGKMVTIDKIRAKDAGGRELKLPSLVYYIK